MGRERLLVGKIELTEPGLRIRESLTKTRRASSPYFDELDWKVAKVFLASSIPGKLWPELTAFFKESRASASSPIL